MTSPSYISRSAATGGSGSPRGGGARRQRQLRGGCRRVDVDHQQLLLELAANRNQPTGRVVDETLSIEGDDVLSVVCRAGRVDVHERLAQHGKVPPDNLVPGVPLAGAKG